MIAWHRVSRHVTVLHRTATQYRSVSSTVPCRASWNVDLETGRVSLGNNPLFQTVIGIEIHAQLDIPDKLFSRAPTTTTTSQSFRAPNRAVYPLDVAIPGFLPVVSKEAVQAAVLTAAACRCDIQEVSRFERKHYVYADLPLGYQMTQQRWPIARNGLLRCRKQQQQQQRSKGKTKKVKKKKGNNGGDDDDDAAAAVAGDWVDIRIDRIQLEQDTGKTTNAEVRKVCIRLPFWRMIRINLLAFVVTQWRYNMSVCVCVCVQSCRYLLLYCLLTISCVVLSGVLVLTK